MKWWPWRGPEVRSSSYTDLAVNSLVAAASGVGDGGALAVSEACARWWSSALASASVAPDVPALRSLTPSTLAYVGRELFRVGESCHMITVSSDGRVELVPVSFFPCDGLLPRELLGLYLYHQRSFRNRYAYASSRRSRALSLCSLKKTSRGAVEAHSRSRQARPALPPRLNGPSTANLVFSYPR